MPPARAPSNPTWLASVTLNTYTGNTTYLAVARVGREGVERVVKGARRVVAFEPRGGPVGVRVGIGLEPAVCIVNHIRN